eukprot:TRINITY_DN5140_c0_g1_i9.p1 TRINITY_DN5140_c0_g1~~TRINITY_DN5140_c0_g1_i9.p1  ORF type:complete len:981 (-),score=178.41 TRINITY_DN5140_c0_g1_i9:1319-4072(-)
MALLPNLDDISREYKAEAVPEESILKEPIYDSVLDVISNVEELSVLETLVFGVGFDAEYFEALNSSEGQVTLFAPTNKALQNLKDISSDLSLYNLLFQDNTLLMKIILNHIVPEVVNSSSLFDGQVLPTLIQNELVVNLTNGVQIIATMSTANVVKADIQAGSSIVHIVDMVLLPALNNNTLEFKSESLPVEYIAKAEIGDMYDSIIEALRAMDDMEMLRSAIFTVFSVESEFYEIFNGSDASITLFAPTDQAFINMRDSAYKLNDMFFTDTTTLYDILLNHMVPDIYFSQDLFDGQSLFTMEDDELLVEVTGPVTIISNSSQATVQVTDIMAGNSVIHVVDVVLIPDLSKDEIIIDSNQYKAAPLPVEQLEKVRTVSGEVPVLEEAEEAEEDKVAYGSILEALEGSDLEMLISTIFSAGFASDSIFLQSILGSDQYVTFFAPSDQALLNLEFTSLYEELQLNSEKLQQFLLNHLVPEVVPSSALYDGQVLYTLADGQELIVDTNEGITILSNVSDADVTQADIQAGTAIIHIINDVLIPIFPKESEEAVNGIGGAQYYGYDGYDGYEYDNLYDNRIYDYLLQVTHDQDLTVLAAALISSNKYSDLLLDKQFLYTLFAPTDKAFKNLLAALGIDVDIMLNDKELLDQILSYHVISGKELVGDLQEEQEFETLLFNGTLLVDPSDSGVKVVAQGSSASVELPDLEVALGAVHVIDTVLLPFSVQSQTVELAASETEDMMKKLSAIPELASFLEAIVIANLTEQLMDAQPITIFAPNNNAFQFALSTLQVPIQDLGYSSYGLEEVLLYHVVPGLYYSYNLTNVTLDTLLEESSFDVSTSEDGVFVEALDSEGYVKEADIDVGNTIIHIIDTILVPFDRFEEESQLAQRTEEVSQDVSSVSTYDSPIAQLIDIIGGFFNA